MNTYRNSIRTKNNIRKAFAELLKENKVVEKITVKDLIERADISKSTFYLHYRDIYDIIEEMENEVLDVIEEALNKAYLDNSTSFMPYLNLIFELLKNNEEQYRLIMTAKYPVLFMDKLKKMIYSKVIEDKALTALSKNPDIKKAEVNMMINGILHLVLDYMRDKIDLTLDQIFETINALLIRISILDN